LYGKGLRISAHQPGHMSDMWFDGRRLYYTGQPEPGQSSWHGDMTARSRGDAVR